VKAFYGKVRDIIESSLSVPKVVLIQRLNPVLRGWAEYHKGAVAKVSFAKLDHLIHWRLMRWGKRRHPRKSGKWILDHYWRHPGSRWEFASTVPDRNGEDISEFNPFDPAWFAYGERLHVQRMSQDIWDVQRYKLLMEQDGKCALCGGLFNSEEGGDDHHIVHRTHGGSDALANRVLLHPVCHRRVHALGLEVTKPVPARGL
jgi:RNA-directed DNA polymerase